MSFVVILILAAVWAVFLIPQLLRMRAEKVSGDSIGTFRKQLSVLQRTGPGPASASRPRPVAGPVRPVAARPGRPHAGLSRAEVRRRRRDVLVALTVAAGATLLAAVVTWALPVVLLHLLIDAALAAYVALLIRLRNLAAERDLKVRFLPSSPPEPALLLRRSAN